MIGNRGRRDSDGWLDLTSSATLDVTNFITPMVEPWQQNTNRIAGDRQLVFIEGSVADAQLLAAGVKPGVSVVLLNPDQDGVLQIAEYLASHHVRNLAAIDIVAHGADGALQLGTAMLSTTTIAEYQAALAQLGDALRPGAPSNYMAAMSLRMLLE